MRHARLSPVLVVLALVAFACSTDSDESITTTVETTTAATVEDMGGLPGLNPPAAEPPSAMIHIEWEALGVMGLDRCAWLDDTKDALRQECENAATAHFDATSNQIDPGNAADVSAFVGTDSEAIVREPRDDGDHLCFIDANEIVTPATRNALSTALGVPEDDIVSVESDSGPLAGGLFAFEITGFDPVQVTSVLIAAGIPASPRYALMPSARWKFGPAGPALPADPMVWAAQKPLVTFSDATITVIDTGSATSQPPEPANLSPELVGHGQFVAGIISRLLPGASVIDRSALKMNGNASPVATEHRVAEEISFAIEPSGELNEGGVINLSLGTYTCRSDHLPLELAARLGEIAMKNADAVQTDSPTIAIVAAAGNDSNGTGDPPFWPAGFSDPDLIDAATPDWAFLAPYQQLANALFALYSEPNSVIGVGALVYEHDPNGGGWVPAAFSNQVAATVWAPGANIVSSHPGWQGVAQWDGTSFAAPHVAAVIADCAESSRGYQQALADLAQDGDCSS